MCITIRLNHSSIYLYVHESLLYVHRGAHSRSRMQTNTVIDLENGNAKYVFLCDVACAAAAAVVWIRFSISNRTIVVAVKSHTYQHHSCVRFFLHHHLLRFCSLSLLSFRIRFYVSSCDYSVFAQHISLAYAVNMYSQDESLHMHEIERKTHSHLVPSLSLSTSFIVRAQGRNSTVLFDFNK